MTLEQAVPLLAERAAKGGGKKPARAKKAAPKAKATARPSRAANDAANELQRSQGGQEEGGAQAQGCQGQDRRPPRTGTDG